MPVLDPQNCNEFTRSPPDFSRNCYRRRGCCATRLAGQKAARAPTNVAGLRIASATKRSPTRNPDWSVAPAASSTMANARHENTTRRRGTARRTDTTAPSRADADDVERKAHPEGVDALGRGDDQGVAGGQAFATRAGPGARASELPASSARVASQAPDRSMRRPHAPGRFKAGEQEVGTAHARSAANAGSTSNGVTNRSRALAAHRDAAGVEIAEKPRRPRRGSGRLRGAGP